MKQHILLAALLGLTGTLCVAETVKLKDGSFVSGSITNQTQYTINMSTSYGPVVLNQREVEAVLPDQHRVHLKGGTQLIGIIVDIDEFNLKLQTEEGIVNIDMPQIVSIEVYDYEQGNEMKKNIEQHQAATEQAAAAAVATATPGETVASTAAGGLSFDADIEKVFDAKKPDIVNGQAQTVKEYSAADIRAQRAAQQLSDEEAFLKGTSNQAAVEQQAADARSGKLTKTKKAEAKKADRSREGNTNKYFSLAVGAQGNDLKLDNSHQAGFEGQDPYDVGGTSVRVETTFLWRLKSSNLWVGPSLAFANISKNSFTDLDPNVITGNETSMAEHGYLAYDPDVSTNGQLIDIMARANYFFNPKSLFSFYATAGAGYRFLTLNYHGGIQGKTLNAGAPLGVIGLGVETYWDDLLIGLEVSEHVSSYSGKFKKSSVANTVAALKFSWKF